MNRPVVIIEPVSSGIELAPAFRARGIPSIAVTLKHHDRIGFGSKLQSSDFLEILSEQPDLPRLLKKFQPLAIIPGSEGGIALADELTSILTPHYSNDSKKSPHRLHKALMQQALREAGVPSLKTLHTNSQHEAEIWLRENHLEGSPLIVKPPISAGSDKVFHIPAQGDWKTPFHRVLNEPSKISGETNETVVLQELAVGTEYAVGTVSADGKHFLSHLIRYNKTASGERETVFDHVEFIPYHPETLGSLFDYTQQVLDALGVRWGAAHTEIMLTKNGPRLIETGARMCGGPVVGFSREASGSSQADKLVEIYVDGTVRTPEYTFKKTVIPVFLKAVRPGVVSNVEALDGIAQLPTLHSQYLWIKNGDKIKQTEDYLTSIGIVALTGERGAIFSDYQKIREMEARLVIQE